jgi:hypothetical protein
MRTWNGATAATMLVGLLASLGVAAAANGQTAPDGRVWAAFTVQGPVSNDGRWRWTSDSLVRSRDGASTLDFLGERIMLTRDVSPHVSVGFGYAYGAGFPSGGSLREHRLVQQVSWIGGSRTRVSFKTRVEERFVSGRGAMLRLRQQVRVVRPIAPRGRILAVVSEELFVRTDATALRFPAVESNRLFVGIGRKVTPRTGVEVGYVNVYSRLAPGRKMRSHVLSATVSVALSARGTR